MSAELTDGITGTELVLGFGHSAWHNKGTVFPGGVPLEDALRIAFPFVATKEGLYLADGRLTERCAILRSDNGNIVGYVGKDYEPVQPIEMFNFLGPDMPIETAGSLKGGSVLFCQSRIGTIDVLGSGDIHRTYLTFNNSFDGSIAAQGYVTSVREVCWNTLNAGLRSVQGHTLKFKHTKNVHTKLEQFQLIIHSQQATEATLRTMLETLAKRKLRKATYTAILESLFPGDSTRTANVKADVSTLFADNDGNAFPDFKGTAYSLLNAVTNYVDHSRSVRVTDRSDSTDITKVRFESALCGSGATLKAKALARILVLSDGSEEVEHSYHDMGRTPRPLSFDAGVSFSPEISQTPHTPILSLPPRDVTGLSSRTEDNTVRVPAVDTAIEAREVVVPEDNVIAHVMLYTNAPKELDSSLATEVSSCVRKIQGRLWRAVRIAQPAEAYQTGIYTKQDYEVCSADHWKAFIAV